MAHRKFSRKFWIHTARRTRKPLLIAGFLLFFLGTLWVAILYRQLETAFEKKEEIFATRIFSDVISLTPGTPRAFVEGRLRSLGYLGEKTTTEAGEQITFTLHARDYPAELLPEQHPTLRAFEKPIQLVFDNGTDDGLLQSIRIENPSEEIPEILLEPETVATLSPTAQGEDRKEIRVFASFEEIPDGLKKAVIAAEDQHFLDHRGVDPRGLARAIWVNLKSGELRQGGSTITLQLVKNLLERRGKNIFRKLNELVLAILLELRFDKREILERYLNEVYLGQAGGLEVHGVVEGARLFFGKSLDQLTQGEMALLVGLIRGPAYYNPYRHKERAIERQRWVLRKMEDQGFLSHPAAERATQETLRFRPAQNVGNKAPYFVDYVKAELQKELGDRFSESEIMERGFQVYTTLDLQMNAAGQKAVQDGIVRVQSRWKLDSSLRLEGALAAVDHRTGFLKVLIGGRDYSFSSFNRILNMRRQAGSTFKPIAYLAAFLKGESPIGTPYSSGYPLEDSPWKLVYDHGRQSWKPKNYEKKHLGWITLREALADSVNTVAGRLGAEVGPAAVVEAARQLGFTSEIPEVPSLVLGSAEVSPIELLRAYAIIANHGELDDVTAIRAISDRDSTLIKHWESHPQQRVFAEAADLLIDLLQTVVSDGTARDALKLGFDRPAAGKTGTTNDSRDAWFAGFTPQLTALTWVGWDQGSALNAIPSPAPAPQKKGEKGRVKRPEPVKLTGAGAALPIWTDFMSQALAGDPPEPFPLSGNLLSIRIDRHTGERATESCPDSQTRIEKFMKSKVSQKETCERSFPAPQPETRIQ